MNALEIKDLSKSFGSFSLQNLTLTVPMGTALGLIGENGASFIFIPREYSLNGFVSGRSKRRICS